MGHTILARTRVMPSTGKAPRPSKKSVAFTVTSDTWAKCFAHIRKRGADKRGVFQETAELYLPAGIGQNTLKRRWEKGNTDVSMTGVKSWLPPSLENHFAHWLMESQAASFCVTTDKLCEKAAFFADKLGVNITGGRKWLKGFFKRHPELSKRHGELLEMNRLVDGASVERWIELNKIVQEVTKVKPEHRYVVDETACETIGKRALVVVAKGSRNSYTPDNVATNIGHTSLLVAISATGRVVAPLIIFQSANGEVKPEWTTGWTDALYAAEPAGYNNEQIMYDWFLKFEEATRPDDPSEWRVLDIDNHFSHLGLDFLLAARAANVVVVGMHPHTTHLVCVLDGGIFASFKANLKKLLGQLEYKPTRAEFAAIMKQALQAATKISKCAITGVEDCAAKKCYERIGLVPFVERKLYSIAAMQETGAREYKRQFYEALLKAGVTPDQEPAKVHLGVEERDAIVADLIAGGALAVRTARVPTASAFVKKRSANVKMQSQVLTSAHYLENAAKKKMAKEADKEDKAAKKKDKEKKAEEKKAAMKAKKEAWSDKKAAAAAKKAAKMAAKAAKEQAKRGEASVADSASDAEFEEAIAAIEAAPRAAPRVIADMGEAAEGEGVSPAVRRNVRQAGRAGGAKKKRAAGGESAVDGAWRPSKRVRR